jgi:dTDP-L-rhamnose 4-epimerase
MKNVLITGGAGFIGTQIVKQLYKTGNWDITVLDSMSRQIHGEEWENAYLYRQIADKCNFIYGDIRDLENVCKAVSDNEYIIHLAAETGTGQSMYQINQYNEVNVMGTSNLLQAISLAGTNSKVKKIVLSSSRSVYGEGKYICPKCGVVYPDVRKKENMLKGDFSMYCPKCNDKLQITHTTENSAIKPSSLYAFTKYTQERMFETMCPALGVDYTVFRLQNVYGVGQSLKNPYTGILSIFSSLLLEDKTVNIFEDGNESRDFINVLDVASCFINSLENSTSNGEVINLGSGVGTSVIEIAEFLKKIYHSNSEIRVTGDFRIGDIAHNIADITKAKNILGFEQTVTLQDGLTDFCKWVLGEDRDNIGYEKSLLEIENAGMFIRNKG